MFPQGWRKIHGTQAWRKLALQHPTTMTEHDYYTTILE